MREARFSLDEARGRMMARPQRARLFICPTHVGSGGRSAGCQCRAQCAGIGLSSYGAGQQPVCGEEAEASRPLTVLAPMHTPLLEPVVAGSSWHSISSPLGVIGQPPPVHKPFASALPLQLQVTLKSTHQCSPVN